MFSPLPILFWWCTNWLSLAWSPSSWSLRFNSHLVLHHTQNRLYRIRLLSILQTRPTFNRHLLQPLESNHLCCDCHLKNTSQATHLENFELIHIWFKSCPLLCTIKQNWRNICPLKADFRCWRHVVRFQLAIIETCEFLMPLQIVQPKWLVQLPLNW